MSSISLPLWMGRALFWLSWPALWVYLRVSYRTRVAIWNNGRLLVVKTWMGDGSWSLPGGGVHKREPLAQAAIRELREETGIILPAGKLQLQSRHYYCKSGLRFKYELFTANLSGPQPQVVNQPIEISATDWLLPSELQSQSCGPDVLAALAA